jgi:hypothetical protein
VIIWWIVVGGILLWALWTLFPSNSRQARNIQRTKGGSHYNWPSVLAVIVIGLAMLIPFLLYLASTR